MHRHQTLTRCGCCWCISCINNNTKCRVHRNRHVRRYAEKVAFVWRYIFRWVVHGPAAALWQQHLQHNEYIIMLNMWRLLPQYVAIHLIVQPQSNFVNSSSGRCLHQFHFFSITFYSNITLHVIYHLWLAKWGILLIFNLKSNPWNDSWHKITTVITINLIKAHVTRDNSGPAIWAISLQRAI